MPTSLFECMTDTSRVRAVNASLHVVRIDHPELIHGQNGDFGPEPLEERDGFERRGMFDRGGDDVNRVRRLPTEERARNPRGRRRHVPLMAWLLASDPPPVKTISSGCAPISAATCPRAVSTASCAALPYACELDGLPHNSRSAWLTASATAGSTGVVAL